MTRSTVPWRPRFSAAWLVIATGLVVGAVGCGKSQTTAPVISTEEIKPSDTPLVATSGNLEIKAERSPSYPFKRSVVISIGIDKYPKLLGLANLKHAEDDARGVADVLQKLYGFEPVVLLGPAASKENIELTIKKYGDELGDAEVLLIYFAGHGQVIPIDDGKEAGYLIPSSADLDANNFRQTERWAAQALDMEYLSKLVEGMRTQHVLFVADACCSGFMTTRGSLARADLKTFIFKPSRAVLAATTQSQKARENSAAKHGYFTAALLDELQKNEAMSVVDIFLPVMKRVAEETNGGMTPRLGQIGNGEGMFVFVPKSIPRSEIEADLHGRLPGVGESTKGLGALAIRHRDRLAPQTTEAEAYQTLTATPYNFSPRAEEFRRSWERRFNRFRENAAMGDAWAMAALHTCYRSGLGTEKNPVLAHHWARQLDLLKTPPGIGLYFLGECHRLGLVVPKQEPAAQELYRRSADLGFLPAQVKLAERTIQKKSLTPEEVGAVKKIFERGRENKYSTAACDLAAIYLNGEKFPGIKSNPELAVAIYEEAASWGDMQGKVAIYETLREDRPGLPKDLKRAEQNLREAAETGNATAQVHLAREHANNNLYRKLGLPFDENKAFHWATLSGEQGHPGGQAMLARLYLYGYGTKINIGEAKAWCEKSAQQNYPDAFYLQGIWYATGSVYGVKSAEKAIDYSTRAADLDHPQACIQLADMLVVTGGARNNLNPHWLEILHYTAKAAKLGAIDTPTAATKLTRAYNFFVAPLGENRDKRWVEFWQTHPDTAAVATKILKENTERLDWFDPKSVNPPKQ
jgi:TPR repeat protein